MNGKYEVDVPECRYQCDETYWNARRKMEESNTPLTLGSAERTVEQGASHSRGIAGTVSWQTASSGRSFQPVNLLDKLASHDVPVDERVLIALELEEQFPLRLTPLSEKD